MKITSLYNINKKNFNIRNNQTNIYERNFSQRKINFCAEKDRFELSEQQRKQNDPQFDKEKEAIEIFFRENQYPPEYTEHIMSNINASNIDIVKAICKSQNWRDIHSIIQHLNDDTIDFARKLCFDEKFPKEEISGVLSQLKEFNIEFADRLCFDEEFPKVIISEILQETTKDNIHFAEKLCFNKNQKSINCDNISEILSKVNKENEDIAETLCLRKGYQASTINDILDNIDTASPNTALIRELLKLDIPEDTLPNILWKTKNNKEELVKDKIEYLKSIGDKSPDWFETEYILTDPVFPFAYYLKTIPPQNLSKIEKIMETQKERCLKYPSLYCNGTYDEDYYYKVKCNTFFKPETSNEYTLKVLADILGAEALNDFLGYRFDVVKEYFAKMQTTLNYIDLKLLKSMVNSKKVNGQNFISKEKVSLIDTLLAYQNLELDRSKIEQMVRNDCLDTNELHFDILKGLFLKYGLSPQEIDHINKDVLSMWDLKYIQLLEEEMKLDKHNIFIDIIKGTNTGNFKNYIHNTQTPYGMANKRTKKEFETYGLNYDAWINPPQSTAVKFKHTDKTTQILSDSVFTITNAIEELRCTPAKGYIDKVLSTYIKSDNFIIPEHIAKNKEKLINLVDNILGQLNKVWTRAHINVHSLTDRRQAAIGRTTISIQATLSQVKKDLQELQKVTNNKSINQTIKMWERTPQKDLFQGNYSNCCIGMNKTNGNVMPGYLLNTMFNMIEIIDDNEGKTIGNALVYYAKDKNNKPYFVIDNIEIHEHYKKSSDMELELREAITEFAKNINIAVTQNPDTPVIISEKHNDITLSYLNTLSEELSPIGCMECKEMYLDLFGGILYDTQSIKQYVNFADLLHPICK